MAKAHRKNSGPAGTRIEAITIPAEVMAALDSVPNKLVWEPWEDRVIMHYAETKGFRAIGRILKKSDNTVAKRYRILRGEE